MAKRIKNFHLKMDVEEFSSLENYAMRENMTLSDAARKILSLVLPFKTLRIDHPPEDHKRRGGRPPNHLVS